MKEIRKKNEKLVNNNKKINQELTEFKYRFDCMEEKSLNSTVEIIGIPSSDKSCKEKVLSIA